MEALVTAVQPYAWGSMTAIPEILGEPPSSTPVAELWVGAHPVAPSHLRRGGRSVSLDQLVAADPVGELGRRTADRFGRFPFLLKILAAAAPLSLQVHPSAEQARAGFAAEEAAGIPRDALDRNYRDDWPKPEIACALTPFRALAGFRPVAESVAVLRAIAGCSGDATVQTLAEDLAAAPDGPAGIAHLLRAVLSADGEIGAALARAVADGASDALAGELPPEVAADLEFARSLAAQCPGDPSVLGALLLNRITLAPGEAVFLPAGNMHAYLSGTAVELMASSDNVLRGGLTPKHVDVAELLAILDTRPRSPEVIVGRELSPREFEYLTPTPQFALSRVEVAPGAPVRLAGCDGPQLFLCVAGAATLSSARGEVRIAGGHAVYARAGEGSVTVTGDPAATVFRARPGREV